MMSWLEEESDKGDWGNEGTNGFAGAGAGVAGAGFAWGLGAAAGDWAEVVVENMGTKRSSRKEKMISFII